MFRRISFWACAGLLAAAPAGRVAAQTPMFGGTLYREFDVAARTSSGVADSIRSYLNLYRDLSSGPVLQNLRLFYIGEGGRTFWDAYARNAGLGDQRYHALLERSGAFRLTFDRDQTPHFISSDARMPAGSIVTGDSLGLPATRPDTNAWKSAPLLGDVRVVTRDTRATARFTPRSDVAIDASWDRTGRTGQRPMGMTFSGSSGPAREFLEPIDNTVDRVRIAPSITRDAFQAQLSYEYSGFHNNFTRVLADNPATAVSTTSMSSYGQAGLAPDNQAHTFLGTAGVRVSGVGRLTGAYSYSIRTQNQAFLPRTVNSALDTSSFFAMPASLNAEMHTAMANVGYTTRLDPSLSLTMRYTWFTLTDHTPEMSFYGRVNADRQVQKQMNTRERYPYSRQSAVAEIAWHALPTTTVRLSDNWQAWNREFGVREVAHTTEHTPKLSLSSSPTEWLTVQTSVRAGHRYGDGYVPVSTAQNRDLVRYDEADRSTRRFDFDATVTPLSNTTVGFQYGTARAHYDGSAYGLQKDDNNLIGVDVTWQPTSRISLTAGAMRQTYNQLLRSRYRSGVQASNPQMDWITDELDTVTSWDAAVNVVLVPRTLEATLSFSRVLSTTNLNNSNPYSAYGVDSANAYNSRVTTFPQMYYYLRPVAAVVRYTMSQTLTVSAKLSTEDFESSDFRSGGLAPYLNNMYYLGNFLQGYGARYFTISVAYRPWVPGLRHAVM